MGELIGHGQRGVRTANRQNRWLAHQLWAIDRLPVKVNRQAQTLDLAADRPTQQEHQRRRPCRGDRHQGKSLRSPIIDTWRLREALISLSGILAAGGVHPGAGPDDIAPMHGDGRNPTTDLGVTQTCVEPDAGTGAGAPSSAWETLIQAALPVQGSVYRAGAG